ncbi:hypothetical protein BT96DRAFT_60374 [Gymnopus androsaceus JB14]|uniref:Uncharacterized protein n=1 Tax=Gymnopus androsaceus JB14 TaxID=1447944 RepID=A0A6A4IFJ6_9AGAR|nr:hypothetical protein BT96DRAFT_60374 [Gymnopus androsaceus JB14]
MISQNYNQTLFLRNWSRSSFLWSHRNPQAHLFLSSQHLIGDLCITHSAPVLEHLCVLATLGNPSQSVVGRGPNELFKLSNVKVLHFNVNISEVGPTKLLDWWRCSLESSMPCLRLHTIKLDVFPETTGLTRIFNHSACQLDSLLAQQITPPKLQLFVNMMAPVPGLDIRQGSVSIPKGMLTALKEAFPLMASKGCIYMVQKYKNRKHRLGCSESLENHMSVKTLGYTV